jgi:hypothetical protein
MNVEKTINGFSNEIWNESWIGKYPIMKYSSFVHYKEIYNDYLNLLSNYISTATTNIQQNRDPDTVRVYRKILDIIRNRLFTDNVYITHSPTTENISSKFTIRFVPLPFDRKYFDEHGTHRYIKHKTHLNNTHNSPYYVIYDQKYDRVLRTYPSFRNARNFELSIVLVIEKITNLLINNIDTYKGLRNGGSCNTNIHRFCQLIDFHDTHSSINYNSYTYKRLRRVISPSSFGLNVKQSVTAFRLIQQFEKNVCFPTLFAYRHHGIGFKVKWMGKGNFTYIAKHKNVKIIDEHGNETVRLSVEPYWKLPIHYEHGLLRCRKHNVRYIVNFISHLMKGFGVHSLPRFYAGGHINCLLIDLHERTIEMYEPFGLYFKQVFQQTQEKSFIRGVLPIINRLIQNAYGFELRYVSTYDVVRNSLLFVNKGVQYFAENNELTDFNRRIISYNYSTGTSSDTDSDNDSSGTVDIQKYGKIDYVGYCGMWSLLYAHLRVNTGCTIEEVLYFINRGISQRKLDLIRNYTAFIENKMNEMEQLNGGGIENSVLEMFDVIGLIDYLANCVIQTQK